MTSTTTGAATMNDNPLLSVLIPTIDDFTGLWATLTRLTEQLVDAGALHLVEIVVADNASDKPTGAKQLVDEFGGVYVPVQTPGTAPARNAAIAAARGKWKLMIDSHVMLRGELTVPKLIEFCWQNDSPDLYFGVCLNSCLRRPGADRDRVAWSHWKPDFRSDGMFGCPAVDPRAYSPDADPFEIEHSGSGLFLFCGGNFPGYPESMRGFGIEGHVTGQYKLRGDKVICLPWLRWFHCFMKRRDGYANKLSDRARNQIAMVRAGNPWITLETAKAANVGTGRLSEAAWQSIVDGSDHPPAKPVALVEDGLGTELEKLIAELQMSSHLCGECKRRVTQMNTWGIAGCLEHRAEIVGWLRDSGKRLGWWSRLSAVPAAIKSGMAFRLNPLDPAPGLVNEVFRRYYDKRKAVVA